MIALRQYQENDEEEVLRLNQESVQVLSPMDRIRFAELRGMSALLIVAEQSDSVAGFLMGFTAGANYDSPNYQWFLRHLEDFLYIDRIVVSSKARGSGIGRLLYAEAREWATSNSLSKLAAEIDIEPPNQSSLFFHKKLGFREIAQQPVGTSKVVSLQTLDLA
jgi:uncharacterized protein